MIHSSGEANGKIMIKYFRSGYSGSFKGGKLAVVGHILQYFGFFINFALSREAALSYFAHNGGGEQCEMAVAGYAGTDNASLIGLHSSSGSQCTRLSSPGARSWLFTGVMHLQPSSQGCRAF